MSQTFDVKNIYCQVLGIEVPSLAKVKDHREAITYSLLLVALLEAGEPQTLEQVAERFAAAGVAPYDRALKSLKRCRPGRPPVHRNGDLYALDPHNDELDLWAFRLGLRPPKVQRPAPEPEIEAEPKPLPGPEVPVTLEELEEAFAAASLPGWSDQRLAILLMEASGETLDRQRAAELLSRWVSTHGRFSWWRRWTNGAVLENEDGQWFWNDRQSSQVIKARKALRQRLAKVRQGPARQRPSAAEWAAMTAENETRDAAERQELESLRRCLLFAFPHRDPGAVLRLDVASREMRCFMARDFADAKADIESYDWIGALEVFALVDTLHLEVGARHLADLGPPQKTLAVYETGKPLQLSAELMIRSCSNLSQPLGDEKRMRQFLREGKEAHLRNQMVKAMTGLFTLYTYCKTHGTARIRRGHVDERLRVPWVHHVEETLHKLKARAFEQGLEIEVDIGPHASLTKPWRHTARLAVAQLGRWRYGLRWIDGWHAGGWIDESMILAARLVLSQEDSGLPVN